ncbi:MAG: hypothetical protein ACK5LS_06890, partial [Propioniciclava sp.]
DDRTHRDLRIAIGRSLRGFLDDDRAWRVLATFPTRSADEARSLLATTPDQLSPRHLPRFAELVVETCQSAPPPVRAEALASLAVWFPWTDRAPLLACAAIGDLDGGPWRPATVALTTMLRNGVGWPETADLVRQLAGRKDGPADQAGANRDRPSAQRLDALLRAVTERPHLVRAELPALAALLADQTAWAPGAFLVGAAAIDWSAPVAALLALAATLDDHPLLSEMARGALGRALEQDRASWEGDTLGDAADQLIARSSSGSGLLALQLARSVGSRFGWPEGWRTRLRTLRSHPVPDVAVIAQHLWTATE